MSTSSPQADSIPLADLPEGVMRPKLLANGKRVVLLRTGENVRAFHEACPHMGADLAEATFCRKTSTIRCKWHGYLFDHDGRFLENPNEKMMRLLRVETEHYKPGTAPKFRLGVVPCRVVSGRVFVGGEP
jgi:nitrite reductase/ring-hydroxylating ferredoxin subunit